MGRWKEHRLTSELSFPLKTMMNAEQDFRWNENLVEAMSRIGRNIRDSQNWGHYMREAGFEDVVEQRIYVPVNPWARGKKNKLLGAISQQNLLEGVESMSKAAFTRVLGWSPERLDELLTGVRGNLQDKGVHAYGIVYFAYGRKPTPPV